MNVIINEVMSANKNRAILTKMMISLRLFFDS